MGREKSDPPIPESITGKETAIACENAKIRELEDKIRTIQAEIQKRRERITALEKTMEGPNLYRKKIREFIQALRAGEAKSLDYRRVVKSMFTPGESPNVICLGGYKDLTPDEKGEILQSVLAETRLTEQEAHRLVQRQSEILREARERN